MQRFLLIALVALSAIFMPVRALADGPLGLWVAYTLDAGQPGDLADERSLEAKKLDAYVICSQAANVGRDASASKQCEIAFRKGIASIPHARFLLAIGPAGADHVDTLGEISPELAVDFDFDRNFGHLQTNDRYQPIGLFAKPGACDVSDASGHAVRPDGDVCAKLKPYFERTVENELCSHSLAAIDGLRAGVAVERPVQTAMYGAGVTGDYLRALAAAGYATGIDSLNAVLLAELDHPRELAYPLAAAAAGEAACVCCEVTWRSAHPIASNVKALLEAGAVADERALALAAASGSADAVRTVLPAVACCPPSAVRAAIGSGSADTLDALLGAGWDANAAVGSLDHADIPTTPRFYSNDHTRPIEVALGDGDGVLLFKARDLLGAAYGSGGANADPVLRAIRTDVAGLTRVLLAHGADADADNGLPLREAVETGASLETIRMLIDRGAIATRVYDIGGKPMGVLGLARYSVQLLAANLPRARAQRDELPALLAYLRSKGATR